MAMPASIDAQLARQRERLRLVPADETPPAEIPEHVRRWYDHVGLAAEAIRWADSVIEQLGSTPHGAEPEGLLARVRGLRAEAFARMQQLNPEQAWFWTEDWQVGEREVEREIADGKPRTIYYTNQEFDAALRALRPDGADL
jgi:hypothetical protein